MNFARCTLLDEVPLIEPSAAFDVRVRARVAAEPVKQGWWAWFTPSPRVAFAATLLLLATVWIGYVKADAVRRRERGGRGDDAGNPDAGRTGCDFGFEPLKDLPQPVQAERNQTNETSRPNQTM